MKLRALLILWLMTSVMQISAKFKQEVELKDGTVLIGYVYRQQPSKFMVFHAERSRKDPKAKFLQHDKDYTLQWKEVKSIRRSPESDASWCNDKVTLKNGTVYTGLIEEQLLGKSITIRLSDSDKKVTVSHSDVQIMEKVAVNIDKDLWIDRQYTNRLRLTDGSIREGLIVTEYLGQKVSDCYVDLMHSSGRKERIFLPDIKEYIIKIQ